MGRDKPPKPSDGEVRAAKSMEDKPTEGFDQYCPTCKCWYPASSTAHAGH